MQNFYASSVVQPFTIRLRTLWLLRNTTLLSSMLLNQWTDVRDLLKLTTASLNILPMYKAFLKKSAEYLLKSALYNKRTLMVNNLTLSLFYWFINVQIIAIKYPNKAFVSPVTRLSVTNYNIVRNIYYVPVKMSNISLHNKYYRTTLLNLLVANMYCWSVLNNHFYIAYQFMFISRQFHALRYYNDYFFKVMHL